MAAADVYTELPDRVRQLRRTEYDQLIEAGVFDDEPLELLDGVLVAMSPQGPAHAEVIVRLYRMIMPLLPAALDLRIQMPLALGEVSEPEPDLAVVRAGSYMRQHPDNALIVVEVARTSQRVDLGRKRSVYGAAGIGEYWVVDVFSHTVTVHTGPGPTGYASIVEHAGGILATEVVPDLAIDVFALLAD